jgi:WD40 repeat protein
LLRTLEGSSGIVDSISFSPDGSLLAAGSFDGAVFLWRVSDGAVQGKLEGHSNLESSVAFSPDGTFLASGSYDDTIRLWRVSDGALVRILEQKGS